jgi:hypothetical protein
MPCNNNSTVDDSCSRIGVEVQEAKGAKHAARWKCSPRPTWLNVQCKGAFQYESVTDGSQITGLDGNVAYRREVERSTSADKQVGYMRVAERQRSRC